MKDAISNLEKGMNRISIIVDDEGKLVGTITDGDIRRAILANLSMETLVTKFMNKNPIYIDPNFEKEYLIKLMGEKDIFQIPVVDKNKKILGLETLHNLLEQKKLDNPVFIMAGGFGKRLNPLTNKLPKPLLKIGSKPILERIILKFIDGGFRKFYISTHYMADKIENYFKDGSEWGVSIKYIHEEKPLGTGGALGLLPKSEIKKPLIMMNGDLLSEVNFQELLRYHNEKKADVTMGISQYEFQIPYGVVLRDKDKFLKIDEKPSHKFFINAGIYVVEPSVVKNQKADSYLDMPALLNHINKNKFKVNVFPIHEYWLDVGHQKDLIKAQEDLKE
jgi:dTDP-glucose pyrophosphorylase